MKFRIWLERRFIQLPKEMPQRIILVARKLIQQLQNPRKMIDVIQSQEAYELDKIQLLDRLVPVHIILGGDVYYDYKKDQINLGIHFITKTFKQMGEAGILRLLDALIHETSHSADPKFRSKTYRGPSKRYSGLVQKYGGMPMTPENVPPEDLQSYTKEPLEFEAVGASMSQSILLAMIRPDIETNSEEQNKLMIQQIKQYLRDEKELPEVFISFKWAIDAWKTKPTLWKKFKQKLFTFINMMEEKIGKKT